MSFYITLCYVLLIFNIPWLGLAGSDSEKYVTYELGTTHPFMNWIDGHGHLLFSEYAKADNAMKNGCCNTLTGMCLCGETFYCIFHNFSTCVNSIFSKSAGCDPSPIREAMPSCKNNFKSVTTLVLDNYSMEDVDTIINITDLNRINNITIMTTDEEPINWNRTFNLLNKTNNLISLNLITNGAEDYGPPNCTIGTSQEMLPQLKYINIVGSVKSSKLYWVQNTKIECLNLRYWTIQEDIDTEIFFGSLPTTLNTIDVGKMDDYNLILTKLHQHNIMTLGLAQHSITEIPKRITTISDRIKYLALKGSNFAMNSTFSRRRPHRLVFPPLPELMEMDLRDCQITFLYRTTFSKMPKLNKLLLAGNYIIFNDNYFKGLHNLMYLDISGNHGATSVSTNSEHWQCKNVTFKNYVKRPLYVDISSSNFILQNDEHAFLPSSTTHVFLNNGYFESALLLQRLPRLQFLYIDNMKSSAHDHGGDNKQLIKVLSGLVTLKELQVIDESLDESDLSTLIKKLDKLRVLNFRGNNIESLNTDQFSNLTYLERLDLSKNSIATWQHHVFANNLNLKMVNISSNKISMLTNSMINDLVHAGQLDITDNPLLCSYQLHRLVCLSKNESYKLSIIHSKDTFCFDENSGNVTSYETFTAGENCDRILHTTKKPMHATASPLDSNNDDGLLSSAEEKPVSFYVVIVIFLSLTFIISSTAMTIFVKWYTISYYLTLIKISKGAVLFKKPPKKATTFNYDVFVSYSENDRYWVLDQLLPQLETTAGMRICLHERDFQVGLSIMENIMDNMHKSHRLLLVISNSFIKSRWCQFEMNLAQFLLVEMRDRQVILVFLENIPKINRPKLLRYLMSTKTYLEWPQEQKNKFNEERNRFFKRLSLALHHDYEAITIK